MKTLSLLTFISASLTVYFEYFSETRRAIYFFKPLTLVFIISIVWFYGSSTRGFYQKAILAGLLFSLIGDTFLINPQNFVLGLASFLVAHMCYIAAFLKASEKKFNPVSLAAFLVGAGMLWMIYGGVPLNLKVPVAIYALAISTMLATAFNFYLTKKMNAPKAIFALSGAFIFVVSDAALAFNKFCGEFLLAKFVILATYFLAQWLIARSVSRA